MVVLVCGGRHFHEKDALFRALDILNQDGPISSVISGGADGADTIAIEWAKERGIAFSVFPAEWGKHGRAAGPIRNRTMLEQNPDLVVAFDGGSGTDHMVRIATAAGVSVLDLRIPSTDYIQRHSKP